VFFTEPCSAVGGRQLGTCLACFRIAVTVSVVTID
jgi:hypothetical protein